jgi:hypothetical protein
MKKISFLLLACLFMASVSVSKLSAQIVLEQSYDTTAYNFSYVKLQHFGEKYLVAGTKSNMFKIKLYNLNHSLWKNISNISVPAISNPSFGNLSAKVLFVSDSLFAVDTLIEFMFSVNYRDTINNFNFDRLLTYIFNENGVQLFFDSSGIYNPYYQGIPSEFWPIVNTSQGTKMILFQQKPKLFASKVFSLPGRYLNANKNYVLDQAQIAETAEKMQLYPNPASDYTTISYQLPNDIEIAKMVFYDLNGKMVKSFTIDHTFTSLRLSVFDLNAGSYYCQVEGENRVLSSKKLIKIN